MASANITVTFTFDVPSMAAWMHLVAEMWSAVNGVERMRWERAYSMLTGEYWPYP